MGKPLSRPGCFRKSSCCLEKHVVGERGVRGRDVMMEGGYGDGYVPQRSIYDTMCINQQIDSHHHHHHHPVGSTRRDAGGEGSFSYSASGSLRVSRSPAEMFDSQPCSLTPNPSFVRRLDERAIYDSLKLGVQDTDGGGCPSPGHFNRSVSPAVSSFSAPGVSSSSKKHHHHYHPHHGESTKSRDSRHSWKVLTPPKHLDCLDITTNEMMGQGGGCLNPAHYSHPGRPSPSLTSPLISPFSGSPLSSGYHTPVFFSPAKPRPSQSQSLRCSPPHVIQPRHYSQSQSLRMSPPHELRRSPYRAPLVQLSAHDLEQDLREQGGWGCGEREREWEREREREMERGWAQREWERERERGRLERERARERERKETSFGTFGYGRPVPLRSDRDSVFLEPEQVLDTVPLLLPQPSPSPSPSPSAAPRMGTGAVGRNRTGSKVFSDTLAECTVSTTDNGNMSSGLIESKPSCGSRLVSGGGSMAEADIMAGMHGKNRVGSWNKYENGAKVSIKNGSEKRMGSQVKTRAGGRDLEGKVESGVYIENVSKAVNREGQRRGTKGGEKFGRAVTKAETIPEARPSTLYNIDNGVVLGDQMESGTVYDFRMMVDIETEPEMKESPEPVEIARDATTNIVKKLSSDPAAVLETKLEKEVTIVSSHEPEAAPDVGLAKEIEIKTKNDTVNKENNNNIDKAQVNIEPVEKTETAPAEKAQKTSVDIGKIISSHVGKGSKSQKSKSSKSSSRSRPGTATGLRPGVLSPRLRKGLADLESTGPAEGIESTWPRRIMVRKRTVRQGGAVHNLPILPPLPSVISALEKRRPHSHLHFRPGHHSENPLSTDLNIFTGRSSLKEPSHQEQANLANLVGRASLKEQNLEHWRVYRDQEESRKCKTREKQSDKTDHNNETGGKDQIGEIDDSNHKTKENASKTKDTIGNQLLDDIKQDKIKISLEEKVQQSGSEIIKVVVEERHHDIISEKMEKRDIEDGKQEQQLQTEELVAHVKNEEGVVEAGIGRSFGEEHAIESWDSVLQMVNTIWDDGWEKGGAAGGDADSLSGSLQRWPLLRPPVGFGGSHPPSSAASELSLTELEKRARELDSDLEHLDLSQGTQDLYQTPAESQKERSDLYQTHPRQQKEKGSVLTGVGSRSQVSLEFSSMVLPVTDTDKDTVGWSLKSAGTSTVGTSPNKEDSSPDSNLTLESDSSGVFLSLSTQSQEGAGSDSDQPISGSDLGSSNTSLEKEGDDGGFKEWGREESAELQWCYPSLLSTSSHEDVEGNKDNAEDVCGSRGRNETRGKDGDGWREEMGEGLFSSYKSTLDQSETSQFEAMRQRRKVTIMANDPLLPPSPMKQPIKHLIDPYHKPIRSSGLDSSDIDPFVQPDSFVYLAVSARPGPHGEISTVTDYSTQDIKRHLDHKKAHFEHSNLESHARPSHLAPRKPEEGDFLCTDSFVYLAAPDCLLLGPEGSASYSGRESDSESSGSEPVDESILGCSSVAGDSDWDSDLSDSGPGRPSKVAAAAAKSAGLARPKRLPAEPRWDSFGEVTEPELLDEPFIEQDHSSKVSKLPIGSTNLDNQPAEATGTTTAEQSSSTKKVTWQFKPAQRSVCTGSRKEKEKEMTSFSSSSEAGITERCQREEYQPPHSSSSSLTSSQSSSSSG
ncbi:uncharacterized protein LOC127614382 [Hippocampus zosterae]|uniref:uncharacterized protein LOC127614382 n=1 Tax=Hippocampus zosterae TaxID=109293 RepID=UPI00223DA234|nr:uncharacterized protein LOC127614382 [Hippocampus zosterae]